MPRTKDVVDGNVNQLDKKPNEAHDKESDSSSLCDSHELLHVGFLTSFYELCPIACVFLRKCREIL